MSGYRPLPLGRQRGPEHCFSYVTAESRGAKTIE
jgi:hypothetical protein